MKTLKAFAVLLGLALAGAAQAGPYGDDLAKCLVQSTSKADRINLVRWFFSAMSVHPAVKPLTNVSPREMDNSNRTMAQLFTRLLTESCREKTRLAVQYEGPQSLQSSFQLLGQVASQDLISHPDVTRSMGGFTQYFDQKKFDGLGLERR